MKLPWRYAICFTVLAAGMAVIYIWHRRMVIHEKLLRTNLTLTRHEAEEAYNGEGTDSGMCNRSRYGNQNDESCRPFLTCQEIGEVVLDRKIGEGAVKQVYLGRWRGIKVAYASLTGPHHLEDFLHGAEMLQAMQSSEAVVRLLGRCLNASTPIIITEYHELGSVDNIEDVLSRQSFSKRNTIRTRFQMCLDYARILSFLHSSPVGTRIMCDSNNVDKTLSQFLITDSLRLVVNDLDALPFVDRARGMFAKCGHKQLYGDFVAPEQLWPFPDEDFRDEDMPAYDEKTDIWKVPDVTDALLGDVDRGDIIRFHLFKIHRRCKELDSTLRPTAEEILKAYQEIFHSIVIDDH